LWLMILKYDVILLLKFLVTFNIALFEVGQLVTRYFFITSPHKTSQFW
jgi:hypothetical protein